MSSIKFALDRLSSAVEVLDSSVSNVENMLQDYNLQCLHDNSNVVDVDFVARRLDTTIKAVEDLLDSDGSV